MDKQISTAQRIRALIDKGHNNKDIIAKLKCKPQAVYNIRYQLNKERGLGSIGELPKPTEGIGAPPKRKYVRTAKSKTGITYESNPYQFAPVKRKGEVTYQITMVEPPLWQRIKGWFGG